MANDLVHSRPGRATLRLDHLVLDVNVTVTSGGKLIAGVAERLQSFRQRGLQVHCITADTRGQQSRLDREIGLGAVRISASGAGEEARSKAAFIRELGAMQVISVGNGANDAEMLRDAALGIAVLGPEGLALDALLAADVLSSSIHHALDLIEDPDRLIATWRS